MNRFANFLAAFGQSGERSVLYEHLKWLQKVKRSRNQGSPRPDCELNFNAESVENDPTVGCEYDEEAELLEFAAHGDEIDPWLKEKTSSSTRKTTGWANAALKYLHLVCLHEQGLRIVTSWPSDRDKSRAKQRIGNLVNRSTISVIEFQRTSHRMERTPTGQLIADFIATDDQDSQDPLNKEDLTEHFGRAADSEKGPDAFAQNKRVPDDDAHFSGNLHCASGCYALKAVFHIPEIRASLNQEWLESKGITTPTADPVKFINGMLSFMTLPRRCCPLCDFVAKAVTEAGVIRRGHLTPEKHTQWMQVTLPYWTPRWLAEKWLESLRSKARKKLNKLQERINRRRGSASPNTNANTTTDEVATPELVRAISPPLSDSRISPATSISEREFLAMKRLKERRMPMAQSETHVE